jgi:hypothetical protein
MAEQDFASFDPKEYTVAVGNVPIGGFMPGTAIEVETMSDQFTDTVGIDALVSRGRTHDQRGTVTLTLQHTSASNLVLSGLHNADINARNGAGVVPLYIRDKQGTSVYEAARCWIVKAPTKGVSTEVTPMAWVIRCAKLNRVDGGN